MPFLPLLRYTNHSSIVYQDDNAAITLSRFLDDITSLSEQLPESRYVANVCSDRYHFTVGLLAALTRRQVTVLPITLVSGQFALLAQQYPGLYVLHDETVNPTELPSQRFPDIFSRPIISCATAIPEFPTDQIAVVLFTSGSTGEPLSYPRTWGALISSTGAAGRMLDIATLRGASVLGTVPHQHSYGLESIIALPLYHGLTLYGAKPFLPADILNRLANTVEPRVLVTTPIHLSALLHFEGALPKIDRILCATAPLTHELAREAEVRFKASLFEIYGCTEIGQIAIRRTVETPEWTCIDGVELYSRDGEIFATGPAAANDAPLNDIVELKSAHRFLLHGRKSDLVNIAGKRSSLPYLNYQLNSIEGVLDGVFVMPIEEPHGVTRLTAYVIAPQLSADEILTALRQILDPVFLPRPIHLVDALPRDELGKLSQRAIAQISHVVTEC